MSCTDPNCKGCQYNRQVAEETVQNLHLTPGITALQASALMGSVICMQAQAYAEKSEAGLYKALGLHNEAREIEMALISEFLKEDKNAILLYAATTQLLAVFADKLDREVLVEAMFGAFSAADTKFFPEEEVTTREDLKGVVDSFIDGFLERCLGRGRQTVQARADEIGVDLKRENMCVHESVSERQAREAAEKNLKGDLH